MGWPTQAPRKSPASESGAKLRLPKGLAAYRRAAENDIPRNGLSIGGKPPTKRRAEPLVSVSDGRPKQHEKAPPGIAGLSLGPSCLHNWACLRGIGGYSKPADSNLSRRFGCTAQSLRPLEDAPPQCAKLGEDGGVGILQSLQHRSHLLHLPSEKIEIDFFRQAGVVGNIRLNQTARLSWWPQFSF